MSTKEDLSLLSDIIELELGKAQRSDINDDGYDKRFRKELTRWLTYAESGNVRFSEERIAQFGWWDRDRAKIIASTILDCMPQGAVYHRLRGLLDKIEEIERERAALPTR